MKNWIAILAVFITFALNAELIWRGEPARPRGENSCLRSISWNTHATLSRVPAKTSRLSGSKSFHQRQKAIEAAEITSAARALRFAGMAFSAQASTEYLSRGHAASPRAPPLA